MDMIMCEEPHFSWDNENHACLGCTEDGELHKICLKCDDYIKNEMRFRKELENERIERQMMREDMYD